MPKEISFPKEITFSNPTFDNEINHNVVQSRKEELNRWEAPIQPEPKKRNLTPVWVAVVSVVIVIGVGMLIFLRNVADTRVVSPQEESAVTVEVIMQPETMEQSETVEQAETVESASAESGETMEDSGDTETRFIEDKEDLGTNVTYDSEKVEQMLDELEALYEQMPNVEEALR